MSIPALSTDIVLWFDEMIGGHGDLSAFLRLWAKKRNQSQQRREHLQRVTGPKALGVFVLLRALNADV